MILLSLSWGLSFFSPCCFKGPPIVVGLLSFDNADDVLTDGFNTLDCFSLSRDMPEAGSTCSASSMRPDEGLQTSRSIRNPFQQFHATRKRLESPLKRKSVLQKRSFLPSPLLAVMLITLSLIYSKSQKLASGNKMGDKLQQSKDCPIYLCKN